MKKQEDLLRKLFATDRDNPLLNDPYINLLPLFDVPKRELEPDPDTQKIPRLFDFEDQYQLQSMDTLKIWRIQKPIICESFEQFEENWKYFTYGLFEEMDWSNVFVAGGSVLACVLQPQERGWSDLWSDDLSSDSSDSDNDIELQENTFVDMTEDTSAQMLGSELNYSTPSYLSNDEQRRRFYNFGNFINSDIDLFLYAMSEKQAEEKVCIF